MNLNPQNTVLCSLNVSTFPTFLVSVLYKQVKELYFSSLAKTYSTINTSGIHWWFLDIIVCSLYVCRCCSEAKPPTGSHRSLHKGPFDLPERVVKTWRAILTCIQNRYSSPFTSDLLDALSPLLVLCLSSRRQEVVGETLTFWCATFDSASEPLVYPNKLRDVFVKFRKKGDVLLKLPGFEVLCDAQLLC